MRCQRGNGLAAVLAMTWCPRQAHRRRRPIITTAPAAGLLPSMFPAASDRDGRERGSTTSTYQSIQVQLFVDFTSLRA
jgi:hypothetical protein